MNKSTRTALCSLALALATPLISLPALAEQHPTVSADDINYVDGVVLTAKVTAIDPKTRAVTLQRDDGSLFTINAGKEVRNFDQIKVGDIVTATYLQAMAVDIVAKKTDIRERVDREDIQRAPKGALPGVSVTRTTDVSGTIVSVDKKNRHVVIQGPTKTLTVVAGKDIDINAIKAGDTVLARVVESAAISVEKPQAK